jgi:hypothetical protein
MVHRELRQIHSEVRNQLALYFDNRIAKPSKLPVASRAMLAFLFEIVALHFLNEGRVCKNLLTPIQATTMCTWTWARAIAHSQAQSWVRRPLNRCGMQWRHDRDRDRDEHRLVLLLDGVLESNNRLLIRYFDIQ